MIVDFHYSANETSYNARNACTLLVLSLSYYTEIAYIVHIVDK